MKFSTVLGAWSGIRDAVNEPRLVMNVAVGIPEVLSSIETQGYETRVIAVPMMSL